VQQLQQLQHDVRRGVAQHERERCPLIFWRFCSIFDFSKSANFCVLAYKVCLVMAYKNSKKKSCHFCGSDF